MSFAQDNGYTPVPFETLMSSVREGINTQFGTTYTEETFVGTGWYKYFYYLIQKVLENETKTAEILQKYQQYVSLTNERIQRPSVSFPGLIDSFESNGYVASVRKPEDGDPGTTAICIDLDSEAEDYDTKKLAVAGLIKDFVAAGIVTQGDVTEDITLSNGQTFTFAFSLPDRIPVKLRLTCVDSENSLIAAPSDEQLRQTVFNQINDRYRLGWNFEPQRYFTISDAQWAESVLLEWTDDVTDGELDMDAEWHDEVYDAAFTDLFTFGLEDIEVVIS